MCIVYTASDEIVTFLHKNRGYRIRITKSITSKGWQWSTCGKESEAKTKEQALHEARMYILNG